MNRVPYANIYIPGFPDVSAQLTQNFQNLVIGQGQIMANTVDATGLATAVKDSDPRIAYSSGWSIQTASATAIAGYIGGYGNQYHYSNTYNAVFQFSDVAGAFYLYFIVGPSGGKVSVSIDGGTAQTVDLYASAYSVSQVFSQFLQYSQHTINVSVLNTHNASSSGYDCMFVGIAEAQLISDVNITPGTLNGVSVGTISSNQINVQQLIIPLNVNATNATSNFGLFFTGFNSVPYSTSTIYNNATYGGLVFQAGQDVFSNGSLLFFGGSDGSGNFVEYAQLQKNSLTLIDPATGHVYFVSGTTGANYNNVSTNTTVWETDTSGNTIQNGLMTATSIALSSATTSTSSPSAGGAGSLPATPAGYVTIKINGTSHQIPYY